MDFPLGRREPADWNHVVKYPVLLGATQSTTVERILDVNHAWRVRYDQKAEGACVGFSSSYAMSILNRQFYDARWLYRQAQLIDDWEETPPEEGTSVRAGMDVLRKIGHKRIWGTKTFEPDPKHGIAANRWARTVDELRACIAAGTPVVLGVNWYSNFMRPGQKVVRQGSYPEWWIGVGSMGRVVGGHAICCFGASDKRQAFRLVNSWGTHYPIVWIPYDTVDRLLNEHGEATIITDK